MGVIVVLPNTARGQRAARKATTAGAQVIPLPPNSTVHVAWTTAELDKLEADVERLLGTRTRP